MEMQGGRSYGRGGGGEVVICYFIIVFVLNARLHKTNDITIHSFMPVRAGRRKVYVIRHHFKTLINK